MRAYSKQELAEAMGVRASTMKKYLHYVQDRLPHYHARQRLLTPDQVRIFCEHFCIDSDELPP